MGKPYSRWPEKALDTLENVVYKLKQMELDARCVQVAITQRDDASALLLLSDVRASAITCIEELKRARVGNYDKEEAGKWTMEAKRPMEMAR